MNAGDFEDILRRSNINPRYNEVLEIISNVNENISDVEDELDKLISAPSSPATELELRRLKDKMARVHDCFRDPVES